MKSHFLRHNHFHYGIFWFSFKNQTYVQNLDR